MFLSASNDVLAAAVRGDLFGLESHDGVSLLLVTNTASVPLDWLVIKCLKQSHSTFGCIIDFQTRHCILEENAVICNRPCIWIRGQEILCYIQSRETFTGVLRYEIRRFVLMQYWTEGNSAKMIFLSFAAAMADFRRVSDETALSKHANRLEFHLSTTSVQKIILLLWQRCHLFPCKSPIAEAVANLYWSRRSTRWRKPRIQVFLPYEDV